jgi:large subunit ribosomal protein L18
MKHPRLVIFRSNRYLYGQIIDDAKGVTLVSVNRATDPVGAGREIAQKAKKAKITSVFFDPAGYKYHGNVRKFAEAAREGGLKF